MTCGIWPIRAAAMFIQVSVFKHAGGDARSRTRPVRFGKSEWKTLSRVRRLVSARTVPQTLRTIGFRGFTVRRRVPRFYGPVPPTFRFYGPRFSVLRSPPPAFTVRDLTFRSPPPPILRSEIFRYRNIFIVKHHLPHEHARSSVTEQKHPAQGNAGTTMICTSRGPVTSRRSE